jgi:hypothetical protein
VNVCCCGLLTRCFMYIYSGYLKYPYGWEEQYGKRVFQNAPINWILVGMQ